MNRERQRSQPVIEMCRDVRTQKFQRAESDQDQPDGLREAKQRDRSENAIAASYNFRSRMPPPEDRNTSFGPPPLILPSSDDSSCLPRIVMGTSLLTSPPLVCASTSTDTFGARETTMFPPDVDIRESARGCCASFARIEPPEVCASTAPRASSMAMPPPEVRA